MIKKTLSEEELEFCEAFFNPKEMLECLYPKGAMQTWNEEGECLTVRNYQIPLLQYDNVLEDDDKLTEQENFQRRIDVGTLFAILGRKLGKSFISLQGNIVLKLIYYSGREMTMAAYDEKHLCKIMDKIRSFFSSHEFFRQYKKSIKGSPEYTLETLNGNTLYGVNETVKGKDPGANWWGHHTDINFQDEIQAESDAAYSKKIDAIGEMGCIEVLCGIPLVTKVSPLGKILKDRTKQKNILRFPQYISTFWNQKVREERERQYGGTNTVGYKVNVEAELIEGAEGCIAEGSKVLMSDFSLKNIEDININDEILTFSEHPKRNFIKAKVLNKLFQGTKNVIGIKSGNNKLWLTPDHKVLADFRKSNDWREVQDCLNKNRKIVSFNNIFYNYNDYIKGLLLGFLFTDATRIFDKNKLNWNWYLTQSTRTEYLTIEELFKLLNIEYSKYIVKQGTGYRPLSGFAPIFRYCIRRKHNEIIEKWKNNLENNNDIRLGFISGFILGDGSLSSNCLRIYQNNTIKEKILERVLKLSNIKYHKRVRQNNGYVYQFSMFEILLYAPKSKKSKKFIDRLLVLNPKIQNLKRGIKRIGIKENIKVWDLTTTSGTFIVNGFLVHNCFDMQRVRDNYDPNKVIKAFEITKENYSQFFNILILDSYLNAEKTFIFADIGDTAATEIGIAFKVNNKYHLVYNITTFRLSDKEISTLLIWIFKKVNADFISVDCTVMGKPIYRQLSEALDIVKDGKVIKRVIWCAFNESVTVGYEKDDNGNIMLDGNGLPVERRENTIIFAVQRLREMFYDKLFIIPDNFIKFDEEMSSYLQLVSGNRVIFDSTTDDHVVQMMQVLAILIWQTEQLPAININMKPKKTSLGIFSNEGD